jgi:hypothetical protein
MKRMIRKIYFTGFFALAFTMACKDDSIQPVPEWGSGVNGFASLQAGSAANFQLGNNATAINANLRWISIDEKLTVNKVETYITFDESFSDIEGNPKTARHGGTQGKLFRTFEDAAVLGNREDLAFTITQADIYSLYQNNTFNYCGASGATAVSVFSNTLKPSRTVANPFLNGDSFRLRWKFFTTDGQVFSAWSPSVCNEFPGSNCSLPFSVVCSSSLEGDYTYSTVNMVGGPGAGSSAGPVTGTVTLAKGATATSYTITDVSFGMFAEVWGDTPPGGSIRLNDACNLLSLSGTDKYGDSYSLTITNVSGNSFTFNWTNTYGDKGTTTLTKVTGTLPAVTTTPSGRCQ